METKMGVRKTKYYTFSLVREKKEGVSVSVRD